MSSFELRLTGVIPVQNKERRDNFIISLKGFPIPPSTLTLFFMKTADCMRYSQQFLLFLANNLHEAPFYWRYTFI